MNCTNYEEAKEYLTNVHAVNPAYIILCGLTEGTKFCWDRLKVSSSITITDDMAFDVQTNSDEAIELKPYYDLEWKETASQLM